MQIDELYKINSLDEIFGNEASISQLRLFAENANNGIIQKPIMLHGPSGTGKTASVHAIARQYDWNVVELNSGDYGDKDSIARIVSAGMSRSIFGKRNLILFDEIDEFARKLYTGGDSAISKLMNSSKNPIIFIANNMWNREITFLRERTTPIQFKRISPKTTEKILNNLLAKFGMIIKQEILETIIRRSNGDVRSAINDLYALAGAEPDAIDVIGIRNSKIEVFALLDKIFFSNTLSAPMIALGEADQTDLTKDTIICWIEENISKRYINNEEIYDAYSNLSSSTVFSYRASRKQHYSYLRYMSMLMSSGIALSKSGYPDSKNFYTFPRILKELSASKKGRSTNAKISKKLQRVVHTNTKRIMREEMKLISQIAKEAIKDGKDQLYEFYSYNYMLEEDEIKAIIEAK